MRIFLVTILAAEDALALAERLVIEAGAQSYGDAAEFFPDGVQDPYRAVDEADAVVWIYKPSTGFMLLGMSDYNYLYADTVMQRAVRSRKPILHYTIKSGIDAPSPAVMRRVARRAAVVSLQELEAKLRADLGDLVAGKVAFFDPDAPYVFLSYAHSDKVFARRLRQDLHQAGARTWIDEDEIEVGDSLIGKIRAGIDDVDYFCVILSPDSVGSKWVTQELDVAMNQQIDGQRVKVLPILHKSCTIPGFLRGKLYADFSTDYNEGLAALLRRLKLQVPGPVSA